MIKDIVVNIPLQAESDKTTRYAASMAGYFNVHVTGVAFIYEPVVIGVELGLPSANYLAKEEAEAKKLAKSAIERFEFDVRGENIASASQQICVAAGDAPGRFAGIARSYDVSVLAQPNPDKPELDVLFAEAALFASGRPLIVVPYIQSANFKIDRVLIAWDGSRPAARAVADSMPLLHRAGTIDVVAVVGDNADPDALTDADMARHLARHGLRARVHRLMTSEPVAPTLLNFAADNNSDLIVMGGYGHSRLREFVLGGATRGILEGMTVPTLMSH